DLSKIFRASRRGRGSGMDDGRLTADGGTAIGELGDAREVVGIEDPLVGDQTNKSLPSSIVNRPSSSESADYLNCPFSRDEYQAFWKELSSAEISASHNPEDEKIIYFEMCVPVEELARRGERTLAFGAMKPIGLTDPRTGKRPYAVVQLRQENKDGTLWGLVGFQSRLKWGEQKRVLRMIPGLETAEF